MRFLGLPVVTFIAIASQLVGFAYALPPSQEIIEHSDSLGPCAMSVSHGISVLSAEPVSIVTKDSELVLQLSDHGPESSPFSLKEVLGAALELVESIIRYTAQNPWILLPLVPPALELWLILLGFQSGGIVAGSIAAVIQSRIGNVEAGSLFAFLQSYGAGGFARDAMKMGQTAIVVTVLLAVVGQLLMESGISLEDVKRVLESVWKSAMDKILRRESLEISCGEL